MSEIAAPCFIPQCGRSFDNPYIRIRVSRMLDMVCSIPASRSLARPRLRNTSYSEPLLLTTQTVPAQLVHPPPMLETCCSNAVRYARAKSVYSLSSLQALTPRAFPQPCIGQVRRHQQLLRSDHEDNTALRKKLKDEVKARKITRQLPSRAPETSKHETRAAEWELTVGIEIHAQLNTARKLFSGELASTGGREIAEVPQTRQRMRSMNPTSRLPHSILQCPGASQYSRKPT